MRSRDFTLLWALALGACATNRPSPSPIVFDVEPGAVTLCEAERAVVQVRVAWVGEGPSPEGPPDVTWRSENPGVVSVGELGVITAGSAGSATLVGHVAWGRVEMERDVSVTVTPGRVSAEHAPRVRLASRRGRECTRPPEAAHSSIEAS